MEERRGRGGRKTTKPLCDVFLSSSENDRHRLLSRCLLTVFPLRFKHSLLPDIFIPADSRSNQLRRAYWKTLAAWLSTERKTQLLAQSHPSQFLSAVFTLLRLSWGAEENESDL